jgi:hypothetical protein
MQLLLVAITAPSVLEPATVMCMHTTHTLAHSTTACLHVSWSNLSRSISVLTDCRPLPTAVPKKRCATPAAPHRTRHKQTMETQCLFSTPGPAAHCACRLPHVCCCRPHDAQRACSCVAESVCSGQQPTLQSQIHSAASCPATPDTHAPPPPLTQKESVTNPLLTNTRSVWYSTVWYFFTNSRVSSTFCQHTPDGSTRYSCGPASLSCTASRDATP